MSRYAEFDETSPVLTLLEIERAMVELRIFMSKEFKNWTKIYFVLSKIVFLKTLVPEDFPESIEEMRIKDVKSMSSDDIYNMLRLNDSSKEMKNALGVFYRDKFLQEALSA